ncbi:hypothetical protein KAT24_00170 [Candidatus Pacearchaeota archaeon]|nr:hypothetical protein [Candidatus Pacearchaeota archaeon]
MAKKSDNIIIKTELNIGKIPVEINLNRKDILVDLMNEKKKTIETKSFPCKGRNNKLEGVTAIVSIKGGCSTMVRCPRLQYNQITDEIALGYCYVGDLKEIESWEDLEENEQDPTKRECCPYLDHSERFYNF